MLPGACFAISIPRVSTTRSMDRKHERFTRRRRAGDCRRHAYVTSADAQWGGMPGNVLLAYSVGGQ